MTTYGLDIYGKALYGNTAPRATFDCEPMLAEQTGYGVLQVSWALPVYQGNAGPPPGWTRQRLVRNSWGVPDAEDDGWIILDEPYSSASTAFLDNTAVAGRIYYYAVFVASGINTYSATQTYQPGDYVVSGGQTYQCLQVNTLNVTPAGNPTVWATSSVTTPWYRAGAGCVGLAVKDSGYRSMIYDLIPLPYKVGDVEVTASNIPVNDDLFSFTSMFGFYLDVMKSENDAILKMNSIEDCTDRQLALIAQQMGVADRLPALPELRRTYLRDADSIQRQAGSAAALAELVQDLTGWTTSATIGYNELPTLDSAAFASTAAQPWNPNTFYTAGYYSNVQPAASDLVTYQGAVYSAYGGTYDYQYFLMSGGIITSTGAGTVTAVLDPLAGRADGYYRLKGATAGSTMTVPVYMTTGLVGPNYNLYVRMVKDPSGGTVTVAVNGTPVAGWSRDLYAPTRQMDQQVYVQSINTSSTISVTFTVTGRQAASSGYDVFICDAFLQSTTGSAPQNIGVPPTGAAGSAAAWSASLAAPYVDYSTEWNPLTGGMNIWNLVDNTLAVNPASGTIFGVVPLGAAKGASSPGPGNSLRYQTMSGATAGTVQLQTAGGVQAPTWSATTPYVAGQPVAWSSPAPGFVYVARNYTLGDQPDLSPTKWQPTSYANNVIPEAQLTRTANVPISLPPAWNGHIAYAQRQLVVLGENIYQAAQAVPAGTSPSGYTADNPWWRWMGPSRQQYTLSAYHYRTATGSGQYVRTVVDWYDQNAVLVGTGSVHTSASQLILDRFNQDTRVYPQSTVATPPTGWTTPVAWQQGTGAPWVVTYGSWNNVDNVIAPTAWNTPSGTTTMTQQMQAGRVLWFDRQWLYGTSTPLDTVYVTFMSAPFDPSNTMEHGIYFRGGASGYWLASRDRLCFTALTYTSGSLSGIANTVVLTFSAPFTNGMRMKINVTSTTITVYQLASAATGWVSVGTTSSTQFNTSTGYGLLERIRL